MKNNLIQVYKIHNFNLNGTGFDAVSMFERDQIAMKCTEMSPN